MIIKSPQALPALDSAPVVGRKLITQVTSCKRPIKCGVFAGGHATAAHDSVAKSATTRCPRCTRNGKSLQESGSVH